ncbi:hypothetical protein FACS1894190_08830 [Spirochaetia bacterium]|nr:hypothetical protein FACS1894190_08830 [Spirochaetia bacterium]
MAVRKKTVRQNKNSKKVTLGVLFWVVFFIVIALLFAINLPLIQRTLKATQLTDKLSGRFATDPVDDDETGAAEGKPTAIVIPATQADNPALSVRQGDAAPENRTQIPPVGGSATEQGTAGKPPEIPVINSPPTAQQAATRERTVYFVKVDTAGMVFTSPAPRTLPASESPLLDTLKVMLQGPSSDEERQGLTSLIPDGTRILSARIQGNTAFINFNENFMFNGFGAEGYIAQLRQIVWTATEFPNIDDVQILIEGRRIDFLGESIRIDRAISRNSL